MGSKRYRRLAPYLFLTIGDTIARIERLRSMIEAAKYSAIETLRDGRRVEIRALRPEDRDGLSEVVGRSSAESLHRRFFAVRRSFTEKEIAFFLNVDFVHHVALVAVVKEDGRPV